MELFFPFEPLVNFVGISNSTNEKIGTVDLPLENNDVTSQLESRFFPLSLINHILESFLHRQLI